MATETQVPKKTNKQAFAELRTQEGEKPLVPKTTLNETGERIPVASELDPRPPAPTTQVSSPVIPVDTLNQPTVKAPDLTTPAQTFTTPTIVPTEKKDARSAIQDRITSLLTKDISQESADVKESLRIAQKQKEADDIASEIADTKARYEKQIEDLEANATGRFLTQDALTREANKIRNEGNKALTALEIRYNIANDNFLEAQKVANQRISDIEKNDTRQLELLKTATDFIMNDLTDSEKLLAEQKFKEKEAELAFQRDMELLGYKAEIETAQINAKNQAEREKIQASASANAEAIKNGTLTLKDIPADQRQATINYMQTNGIVDKQTVEGANTTKLLLDTAFDLTTNKLGLEVGPLWQRGVKFVKDLVVGETDRVGKIEQVRNLLTADNLDLMTGVLSESDIKILQGMATSLNTSQSEEDFKTELNRIVVQTADAFMRSPATTFEQKEEAALKKFSILFPDSTPEQLAEMVDAAVPQPTEEMSMGTPQNVDSFAEAIAMRESGGDYSARGVVVTKGQYKGERALGKYQIMPGNLPSWSREALGYEVTPEEFMASPDLQDKIAKHQFSKLLATYSPADAASVWLSGSPLANNTAKDDNGTTAAQYSMDVVNNLKKA